MHSLDPAEDFAIRLVRRFVVLCEHPRTRRRMLKLVRSAVREGAECPRLYRWINRAVVYPVLQKSGVPVPAMRVELVASQLVGLAMMRYVLAVEPMASASVDEIVAIAAPPVRAALVGDAGAAAGPASRNRHMADPMAERMALIDGDGRRARSVGRMVPPSGARRWRGSRVRQPA